MTQAEKANKYDSLVREGDIIQRQISKIKSNSIGLTSGSIEDENEIKALKSRLVFLENEIKKLF